METARPALETLERELTGVEVLSLHYDISAVTGEEVLHFPLAVPPVCREAKRG